MIYKFLPPIIILAGFLLDRLSKTIVVQYLFLKSIKIFPFFYLTYVENTGAAFGIHQNNNSFFIVVSVVLIGILVLVRRRIANYGTIPSIGISLVLAGALGNLYDRIVYGCVIDFLDFRIWPVFNFADSFITIGAFMVVLGIHKKK